MFQNKDVISGSVTIQMTVITIGVSVLLAALVNSLPPCYKKG
jgi:hypothetical protein